MEIEEAQWFYDQLGSNIRTIRQKRNLSQDDLASHLSLTRASIVNIEKGRQRPPIYILWQLAGFVGVELATLFPQKQNRQSANESIELFDSETQNKLWSFVNSH